MTARVVRLSITPVKSTALHHPERVRLEPHGAVGNRAFYLAHPNGALFTGSKHGPLVRIRADHDGENERLAFTFPDETRIEGDARATGPAVTTSFYGRPVAAHRVPGDWDRALSEYVGRTVIVLRPGDPGAANDVEPVTLVSSESCRELGRRANPDGAPMDPRRFRMLVEIDGVGPHEEDSWNGSTVRMGEAVVGIGGPVPRCVVTEQDPSSGVRDFPTLRAIRGYRGSPDGKHMFFGVYARVERPGEIAVGDEVAVDVSPAVAAR